MAEQIFDSTDEKYLAWMKLHRTGFVLNTTRNESTYAVLHKSGCHHISTYTKQYAVNAFTGENYIKICSDTPADLEAWSEKNRPRSTLVSCQTCLPDEMAQRNCVDSRPKPKLAYSKFCASLGCPMRNIVWSWSAVNHELGRAVFSVWEDGLVGGRVVMWHKADLQYKDRNGGKEKIEILEASIAKRYETYGILCKAKDTDAEPRERASYDDQSLLVLRIVDEPDGLIAYVIGETTAEAIRLGQGLNHVMPVQYAIDDLAIDPMGHAQVDRASHVRNDFKRNPAIRARVLELANGQCEHCGKEGFLTTGGGRYLEAHHVIALADQGHDTVDNVIALCSEHHREAHYGAEAEQLEAAFLRKIADRKIGSNKLESD
ncbi:HNH endonuclease [Burkholderia cepacia]|uniref:HNH endonuclease n=2 Tax=Burkholderia cepacia TaxID=292 RepID=A0A8I1ARJ6_BURCE|nr:HNH endonuclease signature motif containing protein [Burkholderia cepacia]MBA9896741.1 HNH endonuclease [Burkholderia cepacia]MBA9944873.1 HNH endonuclease [Burkholderia cepacia]MBA9973627.1 HNH endonuclease [Burkholderia cepacia]MBB0000004.1 HNH endonuclease [Burkholderia cepacia]MBB0014232.1 HNH endonuclease [Burkholderia cepacia]